MGEGRITADLLAEKGARCEQVDEFRARFPDGLDVETVTPEEVSGLDGGWAVHAFLPAPAWDAYWEAYWEARATSWEEHMGAEARAWETYREAEARAAIAVFREHWQEEESHDE